MTLISFVAWAAVDPLFIVMVRSRSLDDATGVIGWVRVGGIAVLSIVGLVTLAASVCRSVGWTKSESRERSIRQWLAITTIVAAWLAMAFHQDSIAWHGKRLRFVARVDELEAIAAPLREDWPERDGEIPGIGPFMAYPFGRPTTLVLLQAPRVSSRSAYVSAVERSGDGAIKLQLTGNDGGDWAEWHPPGRRPESFVGGLGDVHEFQSAASIGKGWYLVRYQGQDRPNDLHPKI